MTPDSEGERAPADAGPVASRPSSMRDSRPLTAGPARETPMQSVERYFHDFRRWAGHDLDAVVAAYRSEAHALGEDPNRVVISERGVVRHLEADWSKSKRAQPMRRASELAAWLAYRSSKTIFQIDNGLVERLCVERCAADAIRADVAPPVNGAVLRIRVPGDDAATDFIVFYDYGMEGELLLRAVRVHGGMLVPCGVVRLRAPGRETGFERIAEEPYARSRSEKEKTAELATYLSRELPGYREALTNRSRLMQCVLNVLAYLNSAAPAAARVQQAAAVRRKACARSRGGDHRRPKVIVLDVEIAPRSQSTTHVPVEAAIATPMRLRPHVRRAHQRVFWTGKGRKIATVRPVRSTLVHGGPEDTRRRSSATSAGPDERNAQRKKRQSRS